MIRSPLFASIFGPVLLLALLEGMIRLEWVSRFTVPLPSSVIAAIPMLITDNGLFSRFAHTFAMALLAGVLICLIGIFLGVMLSRWTVIGKASEPLIAAFAAAPLILAYPIFLVFFGRNFVALVAFAVTGGLPPVILKTMEGLTSVRPVFKNVGRSLGLTPRQTFLKIELPASLPTIVTGVRLGFVFGLIHLIAFEFLLNYGGLGGLVAELAELYNPPATYAAILFVMVLSALVFLALEGVQKWVR